MKTLVIDIANPAAGDLVIIAYCSPRGGRTHVMHRIGLGGVQIVLLD